MAMCFHVFIVAMLTNSVKNTLIIVGYSRQSIKATLITNNESKAVTTTKHNCCLKYRLLVL